MTAVAGNIFTAAQFNLHVRDNLLETAPAKATTAGEFMVASGPNQIAARFVGLSGPGGTAEPETTSYVPIDGGVVTAETGSRAYVVLSAAVTGVAGTNAWMSCAVSGASSIAASDAFALRVNATGIFQMSQMRLYNNLTPGTNIFTSVYKRTVGSGTVGFSSRQISVFPMS